MEDYTTATANQLEGIFRTYNSGFEGGDWLYIETFNLLNYDSFCKEQQKRVDMGLGATIITKRLIKEMRAFLKGDAQRFSGFEFDKYKLTELDEVHLEVERWVDIFADYYKSPVRAGMPQQEQPEQQEQREKQPEQRVNLPTELQTERAVKYFAKAVEMGFIEKTETGYESKFQSKALLAYFLELVFCRDDEGRDNGSNFPETALNRLFDESRLSRARSQIANNRTGKPSGVKAVESIFK